MADPLRRRIRAAGLRGLTQAASIVPTPMLEIGLRGMARVASSAAFGRIAAENLQVAFADTLDSSALRELHREVFAHTARLVREWLRLARSTPPAVQAGTAGTWIDECVELDDSLEHLRAAHARGRGVIVVTAHLGNWELLAARLVRLGFAGAVVGRKRPRDPSAAWLEQMRASYGARTLPQDSSPRQMLEILRQGGILGLLCDLEVRRLDGEFLPFFGRPALTMTAPAALARASRAPLIPMRCTTLDSRRYLLRAEPELQVGPEPTREERTRGLLLRLNQTYERWIREAPAEWCWHQNRWRTTPGEYNAVPLVEYKRRLRAEIAARARHPANDR